MPFLLLLQIEKKKETISRFIQVCLESIDQVNITAVQAASRITEAINKVRAQIDAKEKELLDEIEKKRREQERKQAFERENLEFFQESILHCIDYSKLLVEQGTDLELVLTRKETSARISSLLSSIDSIAPKPLQPLTLLALFSVDQQLEKFSLLLSQLNPAEEATHPPKLSLPAVPLRNYSNIRGIGRQLGSTGKENMEFDCPFGMAVEPAGRLFVTESNNHRVHVISMEGNFLFKFGSKGDAQGQFKTPFGITFDKKNNRVIVADQGNQRIQVFSPEGEFQFSFGGSNNREGRLASPRGVSVNGQGNIYVSELGTHMIKVYDENGKLLGSFGGQGREPGKLFYPGGIAHLSDEKLVVCDSSNRRLSVFDGQGNFVAVVGEGLLANPLFVWVDPQDNLLVADNGRKMLIVFSKEGQELAQVGFGLWSQVWAVAMGTKGEVYLSGRGKKDGQDRLFVI